MSLRTLFFEDISLGMSETLMRTVMETTVTQFAAVSGDNNPIHLSDDYAANTRFGQRIAHGMFTASLISAVIGTRLPGPGAVYLSQTLRFLAPVRIGDVVPPSSRWRSSWRRAGVSALPVSAWSIRSACSRARRGSWCPATGSCDRSPSDAWQCGPGRLDRRFGKGQFAPRRLEPGNRPDRRISPRNVRSPPLPSRPMIRP